MTSLDQLLNTSGDAAKELIKSQLLELIDSAKSESATVVKESAEKIEQWLKLRLAGELDKDELQALLDSRKRVVEQFLNSQEIAARTRLEKISVGLINLILDQALDSLL
ncbi:hypothetical protein [Halioxenophilus sp. WMMB6]|uniref:hypothetical protein n=1 Tax=Halioxenophilus sp. WMMB6 TaxID=3073815 RepID=UPI00295F495D|nr:hypothetical protein [Halioxenophilus sp. WMMB6]